MTDKRKNEENQKGIPADDARRGGNENPTPEDANTGDFETWFRRRSVGLALLIHLVVQTCKERGDEIPLATKKKVEAAVHMFKQAIQQKDGSAASAAAQQLIQASYELIQVLRATSPAFTG